MTTEINPSSIETERKNAKQKRNLLIVVLLCSNIITLAGLMLLSFHFSVPSKVLKRIENGQLFFPASKHKYADNKKKRNNDYEIYKSLFRVYKPKNINIVMMGNSITRGADWNELLSRTDVANRSIDGDTTEGIKNRLDDIYILKPKVCFVMTGHNDLTKGVEPEKIFEDYKIIIDGLLAHSIIPVIQSTLDMSKKRAKYKNYRLEMRRLNTMLKNYANENKIDFVDINELLSIEGSLREEFTYDGVHLLGPGYAKWRDKILPVISKHVN